MRILVAENDVPLADFLRQKLEEEQFSVELIPGTREAERLVAERPCDLALLDLALSCDAGIETLRHIRAKKPELPLVFLTSLGSVEDRAHCLDAGADDLIPKPFAFTELAARIRAVLRRGQHAMRPQLQVEDLVVDRLSHSVERAGHAIDLSPKEFSLLEFLMRNAGHAVSRATLIEQVWRLNVDTMTNVVDVYVNYLRRKIDSGYDRPLIRTIRGTGYQIGTNGHVV
jgi:two-component system, OmpR family, copper resistance phosphate regulon response regulator CusR